MTARITSNPPQRGEPPIPHYITPPREASALHTSTISSLQDFPCYSPILYIWNSLKSCLRVFFRFLYSLDDEIEESEIPQNVSTSISTLESMNTASNTSTYVPSVALERSQRYILAYYRDYSRTPTTKVAIIFRENNSSIFFVLREIPQGTFPAFQQEAMQRFIEMVRDRPAMNWNNIGMTVILTERHDETNFTSTIWGDRTSSGTIHSGQTTVNYGDCLCVACRDDNQANRTQIRAFFENA